MLKYQRKNYFDTLTKKWFIIGSCLEVTSGERPVAHRMTSFNFNGLFTICACAILFCGLLLALETIYFKVRHAKKSGEMTFGSSMSLSSLYVEYSEIREVNAS